MNERIVEIAQEVFSFKYKTAPHELNPGHHMDHIHLFAELIAAAVISKAEDYGLGSDAVEQLKEDFGVER